MTDGAAADDETGETGSDGSGRGDERDGDADGDSEHLADVEDGAGCTEIWERLSERREE
ncbi:hypothetical protein [Halorubrum sp. GN11_10-6_MGM]|uniref:hypothetical protein n=1 Tax=Halorubrum sp. GN11_10-6_MGM TaxID=2518112 RepID=UPI0018EE47B9|nr:hypothetical protein [Halorubrum sp. GN11_10-6_MGM]